MLNPKRQIPNDAGIKFIPFSDTTASNKNDLLLHYSGHKGLLFSTVEIVTFNPTDG
jgi:hypothetical protein